MQDKTISGNVSVEGDAFGSLRGNAAEDLPGDKLRRLELDLAGYDSLAVAFSSGVDSAFLLDTAARVLKDKLVALTAVGPWFPERESREAELFCRERKIRQIVIPVSMDDIEGFEQNPPDRCYFCKRVLFQKIKEEAARLGFMNLAEGSNLDDLGDYRPGRRALSELGVLSPLLKAGLKKSDIRLLSRMAGLSTADKPSCACLASRFPYGDRISREKLKMVEIGEDYLRSLGFKQIRVRIHGSLARIELPCEDMERAMDKEIRGKIVKELKKTGFSYVSMDMQGFRSGSMNETLS